jgi:hypothetical protein
VLYDEWIDQYDFFGNKAVPIYDSEWGRYSVDVLGGNAIEFVNVVARNASGIDHWIVRNLPIAPSTVQPDPITLTTAVDLRPFTERGTDLSAIQFATTVNSEPMLSAPNWAAAPASPVGDAFHDAEGKAGANGPQNDPGTPANLDDLVFKLSGIHVRWNVGWDNVEQDIDQCAPGAAANSLEWLMNSQRLKLKDTINDRLDTLADPDHMMTASGPEPYTDSNGNGRYDTGEPYTDLNKDGRYSYGGTDDEKMIKGKLQYAENNGLPLVVKFQDDALGGANLPLKPGSDREAIAKGTKPTTKFILDELNNDEDVEVGFTYLADEKFTDTNNNGKWDAGEPLDDYNGNGKWDAAVVPNGGHWVAAVGKVDLLGVLQGIWFIEDEKQGVDIDETYTDSNGNGRYDRGEPFVDANGDGKWTPSGTGSVGFSWLFPRSDGFLELYNYPSRNMIDIVVSESVPEPSGLLLLLPGLTALATIRKRHRASSFDR